MPAAVVVPALISAGAGIGGAVIASRANTNATRMQSDAANNALRVQDDASRRAEQVQREQQDYERFQYASQQRARQPYVDLSNRSMSRMADMLGVPGGGPQMPPQMTQRSPAMANPMNLSAFSGGGPTASPQVPTVVIMAPTGETRRVPQSLAQQYVSKGGRIMQEQ